MLTEEQIYEHFRVPGTEEGSIGQLRHQLKTVGLRMSDPRLQETYSIMKQLENERNGNDDVRAYRLQKELFKKWVSNWTWNVKMCRNSKKLWPAGSDLTHLVKMGQVFTRGRK